MLFIESCTPEFGVSGSFRIVLETLVLEAAGALAAAVVLGHFLAHVVQVTRCILSS